MSIKQKILKRIFDFWVSLVLILFLLVPITLIILFTIINTSVNPIFIQIRIGKNGKLFKIYKIRTFKLDNTISKFGHFLRRTKLDELPQLFNILIGDMSFVGPRPDLPGFANHLEKSDKIILSVKPGVTSLAALHYFNEEKILNLESNPDSYNKNVIWPYKVQLNKEYIKNYSFVGDLKILIRTLKYVLKNIFI